MNHGHQTRDALRRSRWPSPAGLLLAVVLLPFWGHHALSAQSASAWQGIPEAEVRLIAGRTAHGQEMIALEFVISPKWKVYWRSPGDAGYPPVTDWNDSDGVTPGAISWPLPETFEFWGLRTYGYADRLVLPVNLDSRDRERLTTVRLRLSYAACADICVPVEAELWLELPKGDLQQNRHGVAIAASLAATPARVPDALRTARLSRAGGTDRALLLLDLSPPVEIATPAIIIEGNRDVVFGEEDCDTTATGHIRCAVPVDGSDRALAAMPGSEITVTLHGKGPAIEASGIILSTP
ncbi:MAG: protein-disulfide reductase DsbD family protein [Minwuia sp.]|nr:protein-disulfide reductase DsbD family protein [Minwuia sp.]